MFAILRTYHTARSSRLALEMISSYLRTVFIFINDAFGLHFFALPRRYCGAVKHEIFVFLSNPTEIEPIVTAFRPMLTRKEDYDPIKHAQTAKNESNQYAEEGGNPVFGKHVFNGKVENKSSQN